MNLSKSPCTSYPPSAPHRSPQPCQNRRRPHRAPSEAASLTVHIPSSWSAVCIRETFCRTKAAAALKVTTFSPSPRAGPHRAWAGGGESPVTRRIDLERERFGYIRNNQGRALSQLSYQCSRGGARAPGVGSGRIGGGRSLERNPPWYEVRVHFKAKRDMQGARWPKAGVKALVI
jgi:hypothetical protein